jgi:hypothetical protein
MATFIYDGCIGNIVSQNINFNADTFYVMLVTSGYSPNQATHEYRSSVTSEVVATGYTAGGQATTPTVFEDYVTNHRVTISFSQVTWTSATITARAAVIYKNRGGAASADELVAYVDFGSDQSNSGGNFTLTFTTPLVLQN